MSLPMGASTLYAAAAKNDQNAFMGLLVKAIADNRLPHDVNAVAALVIKNDNMPMLTTLLKADNDIRIARAKQTAFEVQEGAGEIELIPQLPTGRSLTDAEETEHAERRAKINVYKGMDVRACLEYAGVGERTGAPLKPQSLLTLVRSAQFRSAIADNSSIASTVIANLMMRDDDQSKRLEIALQEIGRAGQQHADHATEDTHAFPSIAEIARNAMIDSFAGGKAHCLNVGNEANYAMIMEHLDTQGADAVLKALVRINAPADEQKLEQLLDKASLPAMEEAFKTAAAAGDPQTYAALGARVGGTIDIKEALVAACSGEKGAAGAERSHARSLDALRGLLKDNGDIPEDAIFAAIEEAIANKKAEHLGVLLDYAVGEGHHPDIAKRETADESTLLIKALMLGMGHGVTHQKAPSASDNRVIGRMADMLMDVGVSIKSDPHGNDPITLLAERGMKDSGVYRKLARVSDNQIDMGFDQQRAKLQALGALQAKLEMAKMIQGALDNGVSIAALSAAGIDVDPKLLALGSGQPAQPSAPALEGPKNLGKYTGNEGQRRGGTGGDTGTPG